MSTDSKSFETTVIDLSRPASKPFKVTLHFMKNVAAHHRPPKMVEATREETMWAASNAEIRRSVQRRYGFEVMVGNIVDMWAEFENNLDAIEADTTTNN